MYYYVNYSIIMISECVIIRLPSWAKNQIKAIADKKGIPLSTEIRIRLCENLKKN